MPVVYSPLSDSELDSVCLSLVNQNLPYFSAFHEAFVLLYLTGCRVDEIFAVHRWVRVSGYEMRFLPQKDNYHRNVTLDSRCDNFIDAVLGQYKPFGGLSSGQLNRLFYNFSEYSNFRVGSKPVSLYLFWYNFIRHLFNNGLNINQIADEMGYTSTAVVGGYLTATIEKGFFLDTEGFVNVNGTWWSQNSLNWDDGGTDIVSRVPFSDGVPYYYYNYSSVERYLLSNSSLRLPAKDDFVNLVNFCVLSGYSGARSLLLPSLVYWPVINTYMVNAFGFGLVGSGMVTSTSSQGFGVFCYLLMVRYSTLLFSYCSINNNSFNPSYRGTNSSLYFGVRLILDI